jgi:hypothetical protein
MTSSPPRPAYLIDAHANFSLPLDALFGLINVVALELMPPSP